MMLFGSSVRLIFFMTSNPPPSSSGTVSSPSRHEPWQAEMEPPCSIAMPGDFALGVHRAAQLVVPLHLPDADVDLGEVVAPR